MADVAGPSGLVMIGGWIVLFFIVGFLIIIASVFVIRAELKHIKKLNATTALAESASTEGAAEAGNAENADSDKAKES